jgi:hypothetical protein
MADTDDLVQDTLLRTLSKLDTFEGEVIIGRVEMEYSYAELAGMLGKPTADAIGRVLIKTTAWI